MHGLPPAAAGGRHGRPAGPRQTAPFFPAWCCPWPSGGKASIAAAQEAVPHRAPASGSSCSPIRRWKMHTEQLPPPWGPPWVFAMSPRRQHASRDCTGGAALPRDRISSADFHFWLHASRKSAIAEVIDARNRGARPPGQGSRTRDHSNCCRTCRGSGGDHRGTWNSPSALADFVAGIPRCEACGKAGRAGDDRRQGTARQGARASRPRRIEVLQDLRRSVKHTSAIAVLAAARAYPAPAASPHPGRNWVKATRNPRR